MLGRIKVEAEGIKVEAVNVRVTQNCPFCVHTTRLNLVIRPRKCAGNQKWLRLMAKENYF